MTKEEIAEKVLRETNHISFPGLGISEMDVNPFAYYGEHIQIRWYGILIVLAIIAGFALACHRAKKQNISFDTMLDYVIFTIPSAIIGARLYYVIFDDKVYRSFLDVIAVWNGGLAIYGGLIGGAIAIAAVSKFKKIKIAKLLDIAAPCAMLGQIIGRFGNFMNAEAFGYNPNKIALYEDHLFRMDIRAYGSDFVKHTLPTFLFEAAWNLLGLLIILLVIEKIKKFDGQIAWSYLAWYGLGRSVIETLRSDSLYFFDIRVSSLLGFFCFAIGVAVIIIYSLKAKRQKLDDAPYESIYSNNQETTEAFEKAEISEDK